MYGAGIEPMTSCATPILPTDALFCLTPAGLLRRQPCERSHYSTLGDRTSIAKFSFQIPMQIVLGEYHWDGKS